MELDYSLLSKIPQKVSDEYNNHKDAMIILVNDSMKQLPDIDRLIGGYRNLTTMFDNHKNHAAFMNIVFKLNNYKILADTLPWIYRSYHNIGYEYDYFIKELASWKEVILQKISHSEVQFILDVYDWILENHQKIIELSFLNSYSETISDKSEACQEFLQMLLKGDYRSCFNFTTEFIKSSEDVKTFYSQIIQPSLYTIGYLWEIGEISVALEHLSSATIARILSSLYAQIDIKDVGKGKAVVTAAPAEYHEIGAWMVANTLEMEGWDVTYLGANTPANDVIDLLLNLKPQLFGLSITMIYHLDQAINILNEIQKYEELRSLKIIVGGYVFKIYPDIIKSLQVDAIPNSIDEVIQYSRQILG